MVFMDHMMPEMDGIETTRNIRMLEGHYYRELPIIALTANAIMGMKEMFLSHGFNDYLSKPIEISKLDDILSAWIPKEKQMQKPDEKAPVEEPSIIPSDCSIPGIDIKAGKARYPEKTYLGVLRSYLIHTPALLEKIKQRKTNDEYIVSVHGLKGSTYGICAEPIGKLAEALETAARSGDMQYIDENNGILIENTEILLKNLEELLTSLQEQDGEKPFLPEPDPVLLSELANACKHFRANVMDEILGKVESYQYESGGELVTWLRQQVDNLEYDAILERLGEKC